MGPNGVDLAHYTEVSPKYERIYYQREILSWVFIDLVNDVDQTGYLVAAIISSLLFFSTYRLSKQLSSSLWIAILTSLLLGFSNFYLLMSVNGLRQGLSVILLLHSLSLYLNKSKTFILFLTSAILCHNSAVVFAPLFVSRNIRPFFYFIGCFAVATLINL